MDALSWFYDFARMDLNSREQALLIWIGVALAATSLAKTTRPSLLAVFRSLLQPKIVGVVGLAALYTAVCVWALSRFNLWDWRNLKTVILWFLTTAFVTMANTKALERGPVMLGALMRKALTITAVVVFIGGVNTLPLWAELLLLPVLSLVAALVAVAEHKPEHRIVLGPLNAILVIAGVYILSYSIYRIVTEWSQFDTAFQAREFSVPVALTAMFLPYLYALMLFIGFEQAAIRLQFKIEDQVLRRYVWWRGVLAFGLHPQSFSRFIHAVQMADVHNRAGVAKVVATMRRAGVRARTRAPVDWEEGWSPFDASDFLKVHGLVTNDYHPSSENWVAESPYLNLSAKILPDHLVYRIEGTETAATKLELELDARSNQSPEASDERFWSSATALVLEVLGAETTKRFMRAIPTDEPVTFDAGQLVIRLSRDDWAVGQRSGYSRKLIIRHPAHGDPLQ